MLRVYSSSLDAKDQQFVDDLRYISNCSEDRSRPSLAAYIVQLGFVELCQHVWNANFWRPDLFKDAATLEMMSLVLGAVADLTDGNRCACEHVLSVEFQKDLFEVLRSDTMDPNTVQFDSQRCYIADCVMAVLYNVIQVFKHMYSSYIGFKAQIPLVASRHVIISRVVRVVTWRDVLCRVVRVAPCLFQHGGGQRSSSARVQSDTMFCYLLLFQFKNEINSFIETNYGDDNFIHITNKLSCVSRLSRSWWRTCRACCARRDVRCLACCTACATQHVLFFLIPKCIC